MRSGIRQRGTSLIEALVAVLVMGFGMMAVAGIQGRLRNSGDAAKQRAEATRIASVEMERLRAFGALTRSDDLPEDVLAFDEIVSGSTAHDAISTVYKVERDVQQMGDGGLDIRLNISWTDRSSAGDGDAPLSMEWRTALAAVDPKLSVAGFVPPDQGVGQRRAADRHPGIPPSAKTLSNDRSVFMPMPNSTVALVFNNINGMVTGICTVPLGSTTQGLSDEDVADCAANYTGGAYLLSGHVMFSFGPLPDPAAPNGAVLPLGLNVSLTSGVHPQAPTCYTDSSVNASRGVNAVDYYCVIAPRAATKEDPALYWSGRSELSGLLLAAGGYRVCRYSDDYNGDGVIGNAEHPGSYQKVAESLARQSFLVIDHAASCPAGQKVNIAAQVYRNTVTVPHQP